MTGGDEVSEPLTAGEQGIGLRLQEDTDDKKLTRLVETLEKDPKADQALLASARKALVRALSARRSALAAPQQAEGLDVERLAAAIWTYDIVGWSRFTPAERVKRMAQHIAAEYARLAHTATPAGEPE